MEGHSSTCKIGRSCRTDISAQLPAHKLGWTQQLSSKHPVLVGSTGDRERTLKHSYASGKCDICTGFVHKDDIKSAIRDCAESALMAHRHNFAESPGVACVRPEMSKKTSISSVVSRSAALLAEQGWASVDHCLADDWAGALASECQLLEEAGMLRPHCFEFQATAGERCEYRHPGRYLPTGFFPVLFLTGVLNALKRSRPA